MEAECFKFIKERKRVKRLEWEQLAEKINNENDTNLNGEQLRDFVQRGVVPFGGWLVKALEYALEIPERHPKSYISFKGGGRDE